MQTDAAVTSNRAVILTNADTIDTNGFDSTFLGTISGSGSLTKAGTGSLNLDGAQNYATLRLSACTTHVNGFFPSNTATVNANATSSFSQTLGALNIRTVRLAELDGFAGSTAAGKRNRNINPLTHFQKPSFLSSSC